MSVRPDTFEAACKVLAESRLGQQIDPVKDLGNVLEDVLRQAADRDSQLADLFDQYFGEPDPDLSAETILQGLLNLRQHLVEEGWLVGAIGETQAIDNAILYFKENYALHEMEAQ